MKTIDAFKKECPMPVLLAKKAADEGESELNVRVDNEIAVQNLTRFASDRGFAVAVKNISGGFEVALKKSGDAGTSTVSPISTAVAAPRSQNPIGQGTSVFIGKDVVGEGDRELGVQLMKMFLYTLSQAESVPASLLFMNAGVKLPTGDEEQVVTSIKTLIERGTEVLVCGACLNYYGLTEKLKAGSVSNMYEILGRMQAAAKVIAV